MSTKKRRARPENRALGSLIRARRVVMDMSQSELARAIDVSPQQVQKYEAGTDHPGLMRLQQIATALEADLAHFININTGKVQVVTPRDAFLATKDGGAWLAVGMKLTIAQLRTHITMARSTLRK